MRLIARRINKLGVLTDQLNPSIAFLEKRIIVINKGSKMGKLRIAINAELLFVFAEIAETRVSTDDKPLAPKRSPSKNIGVFATMFPMKMT